MPASVTSMPMTARPPVPPPTHPPAGDDRALRAAAAALEANFLAVMLGAAGFGASRDAFGGGAGEEQFASFLVEAHAEQLVDRGGIGLAESLFEALKERPHAAS